MITYIRNFISRVAIGSFLGNLIGMAYGPTLIQWWWQPPGPRQAFSCDGQIASATAGLIELQVVLSLIGAGIFLVFAFFWKRHKDRKNAAVLREAQTILNEVVRKS